MKLAVLGATGPTGEYVVQQALEVGHQVVALVRSPDKVKTRHEHLQVLESNIFSVDSLMKGMNGCEAVISCLGARPTYCSQVTLYRESIITITSAMRACGLTRLVAMTSVYTKPSDGEGCFAACWLRGIILNTVLTDMACMEDYLVSTCSDITWTVIKPPALTMKPLDSRKPATFEGQFVPEGMHDFPRSNTAKFILEQLTEGTWNNKMVAIAYPV